MAKQNRRPQPPKEFGRDGITVLVDTDRALRAREVTRQPTPERQPRPDLRERIEGRRNND